MTFQYIFCAKWDRHSSFVKCEFGILIEAAGFEKVFKGGKGGDDYFLFVFSCIGELY